MRRMRLKATRPTLLNGIEDIIGRCWREFETARPAILGALLDAAAHGERRSWTGSAADRLRVGVERSSDRIPRDGTGWEKNPRALAGHLRRAQTFLRALGIEIAFSRQRRSGSRVIRMRSFPENTVSTVGSVSDSGSRPDAE